MMPYTRAIPIIITAISGCIGAASPIRAGTDVPACFEAPNQECVLREAGAAAAAIPDKAARAFFLATLASQEAMLLLPAEARAHFTGALSVSAEITLPEARLAALSFIADSQAEADMIREARHTLTNAKELIDAQIETAGVGEVETWRYRQHDLEAQQTRIEASFAAAERDRQASADAVKRDDPFTRLLERTVAASRQIGAGDRIGATETLAAAALDTALLTEPEQQLTAWLEIGRLRLELGRCDAARTAAGNALASYRQLEGGANLANWTTALMLFFLQLTDE